MAAISSNVFHEVGRKLSGHSLRISLDLKDYDDKPVDGEELKTVKEKTKAESGLETRKSDSVGFVDDGCLDANRNAMGRCCWKYRKILRFMALLCVNSAVLVYFVFASLYWRDHSPDCNMNWCDGYGMLVILLVLIYGGVLYASVLKRYFKSCFRQCFRPISNFHEHLRGQKKLYRVVQIVFYLLILAAIVAYIVFDTVNSRNRLISFIGFFAFLIIGWIFSKHPTHINWRIVIWGLILQFVFGLLTIRWAVGRAIFECIGNKVATFLQYSYDGAAFVYSEELVVKLGIFAFSAVQCIFFLSFIVQILHYLGIIQWIVLSLGWILHSILGTSVCETANAVANIFLGMSESPLLLKPYLKSLTSSEIHCIMSSGFATVSGTTFAAYISFGARASHLITASVMSAPAALCFSKLFYPETEKKLISFKDIPQEPSGDTSVLDAASKGATAAIPMVLGVMANIVAFVSFVAFLNGVLSFFAGLVGYDYVTIDFILSRVFMPISWIMGVPWDECEYVGNLIGLKTVVNEFVAYKKLGDFKEAGLLSPRTEAIATYAICGFSNPGSIGIMVGALTTLAPEKRQQITSCILRAFLSGCAVCFLTACIAGMLTDDSLLPEAVANVTTGAFDLGR